MSGVLVIDDDADVRSAVRALLERAGHEVHEAPDGRSGLRALYDSRPEVVLLDVSMPGMDGWETLARIRELSDLPVLMLTGQGGEMERVRGLRGGADDYVLKPFGRQELLARVERSMRRSAGPGEPRRPYSDGLLELDPSRRRVIYAGREVQLSPREYRLLGALVRDAGHVLSREELLSEAWGGPLAASPEQVKLYVGYLRRKLAPEDPHSTPLETVRGFGYRWAPTADR